MRLLLDEHLDNAVAAQLRARGFDVSAVTESEGLVESSDAELLEKAVEEHRAIVTYDVADFHVEVALRSSNGQGHLGVVLLSVRRFPQGKRYMAPLVAALERLLRVMPADDALADRVIWLPADDLT